MPREPVFCADCDNLHPDSKSRHPARWMCVKFPRLEGFGFVTKTQWDRFDPFMYCGDINGGACPLYTRRRDGQLEMGQ